MTNQIQDALAKLPAHLAPNRRYVYAEATDPAIVSLCQEHFARKAAALRSFRNWMSEHGAVSFLLPHAGGHPLVFLFAGAPNEPGWIQARSVKRRPEGNPYKPSSKGKPGPVLLESLKALPQIPDDNVIIRLLGAPGGFSYHYAGEDKSRGSSSIGSSNGSWYFTTLARLDERYFVGFPNPFFDFAHIVRDEHSWFGKRPDLVIEGDVLNWRPSASWTLRSKAEVELIAAELQIKAERENQE